MGGRCVGAGPAPPHLVARDEALLLEALGHRGGGGGGGGEVEEAPQRWWWKKRRPSWQDPPAERPEPPPGAPGEHVQFGGSALLVLGSEFRL